MVLKGRPTDTANKPSVVRCRSRISGALGDTPFEVGDLIDVPTSKFEEWSAAGLIDPPASAPTERDTGGDR